MVWVSSHEYCSRFLGRTGHSSDQLTKTGAAELQRTHVYTTGGVRFRRTKVSSALADLTDLRRRPDQQLSPTTQLVIMTDLKKATAHALTQQR